MPYNTKAVANYILELADVDNLPVSPMKLHKLLYYAHGWYLAVRNSPLLDERIAAWDYGPVVPSIYHVFKHYGNSPITSPIIESLDGEIVDYPKLPDDPSDQAARDVVKRVWEQYKKFSAIDLSTMTHKPGTPWYETVEPYGGHPPKNVEISDKLIRDYFVKISQTAVSSGT